jgi:hypothetical protein
MRWTSVARSTSAQHRADRGVKYKIEREQLATFRDQRRDSQAVYVGTAFKF